VAGVELRQLDRGNPGPRTKYLNGGEGAKYIFLYHACVPNAPVHVFAFFLPSGSARLYIVDPAARRQPLPRLHESYTELRAHYEKKFGTSASYAYPEHPEFAPTYHSSDATALKVLSRDLGLHEAQSYTVVLSSMKDQTYFDTLVPKLSKFPVLIANKAKESHSLDVFPWQSGVSQKMFRSFFSFAHIIDRMISFAEYYDVPLGHIDGDQLLFLSDINFARRVAEQDGVLWWSPTGRPDLGGIEEDRRFTEDLPGTDFLTPGCYANVCLELTVRNLAVNSVLHSVVVNELEGAGGATAFDAVSHTMDEFIDGEASRDLTLGESNVAPQTFVLLKGMVKSWMLDRIRLGNNSSPATIAVDHFWRWVSSRSSHMYDPGIHRFVHGLMRKTFIQLLAELKRLGSQVVYADFSRILLVTAKPPGAAHAYATYITTAATSHELFEHLYLRTDRFYDFMLFMDQSNAASIVCEDPLAIEQSEELVMEMKWDIARYLPLPLQRDFNSLCQFFLLELHKTRKEANGSARAPLRVLPNGEPDTTQRDTGRAKELDAMRDFIQRRLTRKLFRAIESIQTRIRAADAHEDDAFAFPVLPGGQLASYDPTFEFIKAVCAVFELARDYTAEVMVLKKNALELIGYKAFGDQAMFRNPCDPLRLHNVPCARLGCDLMRDFDFCRDQDLSAPDAPKWLCQCGAEFDRIAIEFELLEVVSALERAFAQQDLRCVKCKQIRSDNLSRHCNCSGAYVLTMSKTDARRKMRTIVNVARMHKLPRLRVRTVFFGLFVSF
jgi:DNA polymerase epsilon subunit 1